MDWGMESTLDDKLQSRKTKGESIIRKQMRHSIFRISVWVTAFLLLLVSPNFAAPQKVEPNTAYRLTFNAEGDVEGARWAVHLRNKDGNLPYDGALENGWQKLKNGQKSYTHLFYTPADAATFDLSVVPPAKNVKISDVRLEKEEPESGALLLNGDLSVKNQSGWSETYNTVITEEDGQPILHVQQNGYAFTDYLPVIAGQKYTIRDKRLNGYGPVVRGYDELYYYTGTLPKIKHTQFVVPEGVSYVRLEYKTTHEHLENLRTTRIVSADIQIDKSEDSASPEKTPGNVWSEDWEIVLAANSDAREVLAARELQHWTKSITGKAPALLAEPSKAKTRKIFVGSSRANLFADDLKKLKGTDGFAIRTRDNNIYVFSDNPRGTLYGVYALLERNTDIIWPRPNPDFEAIFTKTPRIDFADADVLSIPVFKDRFISKAGTGNFREWQGRNGLNSPHTLHTGNSYFAWQRGAQLGYGGSYHTWLSRGGALSDEKVLPLVDGKRDKSRWRQPCYTYHGTAEGIAAGIRKALQALPGMEMEYLHTTISDNWSVCGDPGCLAPILLPNGQKLETTTTDSGKNPLFFSTRNFMMLNKVAENLKKDYPNIKINTHAYIFTAEPPAVPIDSAIIAEYAAYPTQNVRYPILDGQGQNLGNYTKDMWKRRFEGWGKIKAGELGTFGYYYPDGFNAVADTAAADFRALANFKAVEAHTEGFPSTDGEKLTAWDADGIEKWVIAKLMWDPSQDPEALRKEYIRRVYHGAEKEMTEFYGLIRKAWHEAPENVFINCHTSRSAVYQQIIVDQGIENNLSQLLSKAEKTASTPQSKKLVQRHIAYFGNLGATLGRIPVPHVPEAADEWRDLSSPHWEKASVVEDFMKVQSSQRYAKKTPADYPTTVRVMHDNKNLYVRFDGRDGNMARQVVPNKPAGEVFPNGDRFELLLRSSPRQYYYFAMGPGGHYYSNPHGSTYSAFKEEWTTFLNKEADSWTGVFSIPLSPFGSEGLPEAIDARFGRVARLEGDEREESSSNGASLYNEHGSLWSELTIRE